MRASPGSGEEVSLRAFARRATSSTSFLFAAVPQVSFRAPAGAGGLLVALAGTSAVVCMPPLFANVFRRPAAASADEICNLLNRVLPIILRTFSARMDPANFFQLRELLLWRGFRGIVWDFEQVSEDRLATGSHRKGPPQGISSGEIPKLSPLRLRRRAGDTGRSAGGQSQRDLPEFPCSEAASLILSRFARRQEPSARLQEILHDSPNRRK